MKLLEHINEKRRSQEWTREWPWYLRLGREDKDSIKGYKVNGQRQPVGCVVREDKEENLENLEKRYLIKHRCAAT